MKFSILLVLIILSSILILMPKTVSVFGRDLYRPQININAGPIKFIRDLEFRLGLDLQGGTHLVYESDMSKIEKSQQEAALVATKDNLTKRIDSLGVSESSMQVSRIGEKYRLLIDLPGIKDVNQALQTIGTTAKLDFRELPENATAAATINDLKITDLSGKDLKSSSVQFNGQGNSSGQPVVGIEFSSEGARKFADITKRNIGKPLAIFLDDRPVMSPTVQSVISDGRAVISGNFTVDDAKRLSIQLNAGALPVPIKIVEQKNIGATLGSKSVEKSLIAGLIGLISIWIFMIANYGKNGVLACISLSIYVLISLCIYKLIPVTLTLAGIAGFVLSVGMAVDANILIFERIKEELRWGRPKNAAIELGFHRAWVSVRDSNASSIITATILFWFGSGTVRGFALTLLIGVFISLFTSITITRSLVRIFNSTRK